MTFEDFLKKINEELATYLFIQNFLLREQTCQGSYGQHFKFTKCQNYVDDCCWRFFLLVVVQNTDDFNKKRFFLWKICIGKKILFYDICKLSTNPSIQKKKIA
jgi:hypothetical protein